MANFLSENTMEKICNPIGVSSLTNQGERFYLADPYVLRFAGCYYCYNTSHNGVTLLVSPDLYHFHHVGYALQCENEQEFWAPCVVYQNGTFYMYYSSRSCDEDDVHMQRLKVATAKSPQGPFEYKATLSKSFCIDADVIVYPDKPWTIFYATNDLRGNDPHYPGTCIVEDKLVTPFKLAGTPREAIVPTNQRELFCRNRFGDGRDWFTIEAPCLYENQDRQFLLYSGNAYTSENYFVDYALPNRQMWKKRSGATSPLLRTSKHVMGTGHNSITKAPNLADDWIVYHGMRDLPAGEGQETRELCISRLIPSARNLRLLEPPSGFLHRPFRPEVHCFTSFDQECDFSIWESINGDWQVHGDCLTQMDCSTRALALLKKETRGFICEVSFVSPQSFRNNIFGIAAAYIDEKNYTDVLVDTGRQELQIHYVRAGIQWAEKYPIINTDFSALHTLKVERTAGWLRACIDGFVVAETAIGQAPARVGLVSMCSPVHFSGFSFNECYQMDKSNIRYSADLLEAINHEEPTCALLCTGETVHFGTTPMCFKDLPDSDWQIVVEVQNQSPLDIEPQFSIRFPSVSSKEENLGIVFEYQEGCISVFEGDSRKVYPFCLQESNTIVLIKRGSNLYVYADGSGCTVNYRYDSEFLICANGEFELKRIIVEKIK